MSLVRKIINISFIKKIVGLFLERRARDIVGRFSPYLDKSYRILDLGAGSCHISKLLKSQGYNITAVDVKNLSFFDDFQPVLYDGQKLPFANNEFAVGLLITVLHHTSNPENIIKEIQRVASKLLIIEEDIYANLWQKYATFFIDSLLNLEFFHHPHSNKTDNEWRLLFKEMGLKLKDVKYYKSHLFLHHATYILDNQNNI